MKYIAGAVVTLLLLGCDNTAYADDRFIETRYCGMPERTATGKIKRSGAVVREFERLYPLPTGHARADWAVDHVIPLANGGCDAVRNMQWLPVTGKSCAAAYCKDRYERTIYPLRH